MSHNDYEHVMWCSNWKKTLKDVNITFSTNLLTINRNLSLSLKLELLVPKFSTKVYFQSTDDAICIITIYSDDTTLYSRCDQKSHLWPQLKFASALKSDLNNTMNWGKKQLVNFNAGKTQLVLLNQFNNSAALM